jgi:NADPH:quinone reductase-like Zn-dependent oxidoreductase
VRAVEFKTFGGPDVLQLVDVPEPHPSAGQVRVRVRAVGVNPADWKFRRGAFGGDLPQRTGHELAGVVDEVGAGVTDVHAGDDVFGFAVDAAGAADYALLAEYARIPPGFGFIEAASVPVAAETAFRTLDLLGVAADTTVLINGAAGVVGSAAAQVARARGARVIGTASPTNHDFVLSLGAEPVPYGDGLAERVREVAPDGIDLALDAAGGGVLPVLVALTGDADRVVTIADFEGAEATGVRFSAGMAGDRATHALADVVPLIASGKFSIRIAEVLPLERVRRAHELSETGHARGKLILSTESIEQEVTSP